jgi:hypothetical protein
VPYQPHWKMTAIGTIGPVASPYEQFSLGVALDLSGQPNTSDAVQEAMADQFGQYIARSTTHISSHAHIVQIAMARIGANGVQEGETWRFPLQTQGGGSPSNMPPQVACRVSLGSGLRGRSQKGGWYLPCPSLSTNTGDGLISTQDATDILTSTVNFCNGIEQVAPGFKVVVASSVAGNVPVRVVRVGRRLDVIRRRANAIPEAYVVAERA